jgi:hypothetical protein
VTEIEGDQNDERFTVQLMIATSKVLVKSIRFSPFEQDNFSSEEWLAKMR